MSCTTDEEILFDREALEHSMDTCTNDSAKVQNKPISCNPQPFYEYSDSIVITFSCSVEEWNDVDI